ncbi:hypothetical protein APUTEX25_002623 [Auxenochlorella protothecoides]|uniref:Transmembrane protein 45B n=1 Tax=Auxenochlorella protothecoides TaxID=3075 RepID=A0A1D2ACG0_AUXPR|nr:hypothetical protein APUTEX25_002623 [Auxenochlorella protothecoides]|eukprot:RMZ54046.1 hypothetical protein APUTEX25_002623 [Auxenochlorella protothecoides]
MDMHAMGGGLEAGNATMTMHTECDGSLDISRKGSWQGHILPGSVFVMWGAWWAYNVCLAVLKANHSRPYAAQPWFRMGLKRFYWMEPLLKIILPPLAVSVELYFDHTAFRYLYCPKGTQYAGRYAVTHMNNWQHTSIYPAFLVSGVTDVLCLLGVPLPPGTGQSVLALAFGVMSFIMGSHRKHEPLDAAVHLLLFYSMLLVTAALLAELARPSSPALGLARAWAAVFLGAWLCEVGVIEFDGLPQWSTDYAGSAMFAPVVWAMIGLLVASALLALFASLAALQRRGLLPAPPPRVAGSGADGDCPWQGLDPKVEPRQASMGPDAGAGQTYTPVSDGQRWPAAFHIDV